MERIPLLLYIDRYYSLMSVRKIQATSAIRFYASLDISSQSCPAWHRSPPCRQAGTHSQTVATYGHIAASSTGVQDMADSSYVLTSLQGSPQVSHLKLLVLQYTRDNPPNHGHPELFLPASNSSTAQAGKAGLSPRPLSSGYLRLSLMPIAVSTSDEVPDLTIIQNSFR